MILMTMPLSISQLPQASLLKSSSIGKVLFNECCHKKSTTLWPQCYSSLFLKCSISCLCSICCHLCVLLLWSQLQCGCIVASTEPETNIEERSESQSSSNVILAAWLQNYDTITLHFLPLDVFAMISRQYELSAFVLPRDGGRFVI